jgi:hypothetical protein
MATHHRGVFHVCCFQRQCIETAPHVTLDKFDDVAGLVYVYDHLNHILITCSVYDGSLKREKNVSPKWYLVHEYQVTDCVDDHPVGEASVIKARLPGRTLAVECPPFKQAIAVMDHPPRLAVKLEDQNTYVFTFGDSGKLVNKQLLNWMRSVFWDIRQCSYLNTSRRMPDCFALRHSGDNVMVLARLVNGEFETCMVLQDTIFAMEQDLFGFL